MRIRDVALPALTCALLVGTAQLAAAPPAAAAGASWTVDLGGGDAVGVVVADGTARLDGAGAHLLPGDSDGAPVPTGLLTLDARDLVAPTDRIGTAVTAEVPAGSTATVDVRGLRPGGGWTEWMPAVGGVAALPERVEEVQGRLVLAGAGDAAPAVSDVVLSALPATAGSAAEPVLPRQRHRVFATREGLVGGTTANGHVIAERDHFVALPSRRALSPRGTGDYSVQVCAPTGRCAFAPVWDVGPWNTRDDYWNPSEQRQEWKDLPRGVPQAQAAHADGYNGGRDQYDRRVANPAGIDLGDGLFWDALGLEDNAWVTVDYLWTGTARLAPVVADGPVDVRAAPAADAEVVGVAAGRAAVPVECAAADGDRTWLRIGPDQYLDAAAVPDARVQPCPAGGGAVAGDAAPGPGVAAAGSTADTAPAEPAAVEALDVDPADDDPVDGGATDGDAAGEDAADGAPDGASADGDAVDGGAVDGGAVDDGPVVGRPVGAVDTGGGDAAGPVTVPAVVGAPSAPAPPRPVDGPGPTAHGCGGPPPGGAPAAGPAATATG